MKANHVSFDSNILIYAVDKDAKGKHDIALQLIVESATIDSALSLQSLSEFFYVITRKGKISTKAALEHIQDWQTIFPTITAKPTTLGHAIALMEKHHLAFWDSMMLATAREAGVTTLFSEDFQHGQILDGVRIVNPFMHRERAHHK